MRPVPILILGTLLIGLLAIRSTGGAAPVASGTTRCGEERWAVKTLSDKREHLVNFKPKDTTVNALRKKPSPGVGSDTPRIKGVAQAASKRGAVLVKDINPGDKKSSSTGGGVPGVSVFTNVAGTLFLAAGDRRHGQELWRSDGTRKGTRLVKDIRPGPRPCANSKGACRGQGASSYPSVLTAVGRTLYFTAADGVHGQELWRSDGTARGTRIVKDIVPGPGPSNPEALTNVGGTLFFSASDGTHTALWRTDGTAAGTTLVKEVEVQYPTSVGSILYFGANGGLWRSDGTTSGTVLIKQFHGEAGCGSAVCWLTDVAGTLFFTANDGSHYGLWRSDGTEAGTTLVKEGVRAIERTPVGSILYFTTLDYSNSWLWRSDRTEAGTVPVTSVGVSPEGDGPWPQLTYADGPLYFVRNGSGWPLMRTDGTPGGTKLVRSNIIPRQLIAVGKTLYLEGYDQKHGNELWRSDGTPRGTRLVTDIKRGERSANLSDLTAVGKTLFFSANDGVHGTELWRAGAKPCKKTKGKCKKG